MWYEWYDVKNLGIISDFDQYSELVTTVVQNLIDFGQEALEGTMVVLCDQGVRSVLVSKDEIVNWAKEQI